jgi:hypothetical protein
VLTQCSTKPPGEPAPSDSARTLAVSDASGVSGRRLAAASLAPSPAALAPEEAAGPARRRLRAAKAAAEHRHR